MTETQFAWVIELGDSPVSQPLYWTAGLPVKDRPPTSFSSDHLQAVRFAREEDAAKVASALVTARVRICEHGWV